MASNHPARYSRAVLPVLERWLPTDALVLDPFAGTGERARELPGVQWVRIELEPEWADMIVGNALALPFRDRAFQAIATSPVYGNRMSDHHEARDASTRMTYRHKLGRPLHADNAGQLQWGPAYRAFHCCAWAECLRVLAPGGWMLVNVSDHIRGGERQMVVDWHRETLQALGLMLWAHEHVPTPRMKNGANSELRVEDESVLVFRRLL